MPNWCENTLTITGTAEAVLAFRRANASDKLEIDFERSVVRRISSVLPRLRWGRVY